MMVEWLGYAEDNHEVAGIYHLKRSGGGREPEKYSLGSLIAASVVAS
jgi:hypothetical protein